MKSLGILQQLLAEAQVQLRASTRRDWLTIQKRHRNEGDSFLGITLPAFSEWVERSLHDGQVDSSIYVHFKRKPGRKSVLPSFLHGLTSLVFCSRTGLVLKEPDETAVLFIRQVCLLHKKLFVVCKPERLQASIASYEELDVSLGRVKLPYDERVWWDVQTILSMFMPGLEEQFITACSDIKIMPKHGPGATADKAKGNEKFRRRDFYRRWRGVFSWEELYGYSTVHQANGPEVEPYSELPVKVVAVPKTMSKARIIAVEPTAMQYAQQLTAARFRTALEVCGISSQLNLHNQGVNQRLAKLGSMGGKWATLDLSDASDRLHSRVVGKFFKGAPTLRTHLFACRSKRAKLPNGRILRLSKYASMGSALTFPVEAFCFYVISVAAVYADLFQQYCERYETIPNTKEGVENLRTTTAKLARQASKLVFAYGDDIIIPTASASRVVLYLEKFLLKVNTRKSFWKGQFRESCGHDYLNGQFVTPIYCRTAAPKSPRDAVEFTSWVNMSNRFHNSGFWATAEYIRRELDKIVELPLVGPRCEGLGYVHYTGAYQPSRWSKRTTSWKVYSLVPSSRSEEDLLENEDALLADQIRAERQVPDQLVLFPWDSEGSMKWLSPKAGKAGSSRTESPVRESLRLRRKMVSAH